MDSWPVIWPNSWELIDDVNKFHQYHDRMIIPISQIQSYTAHISIKVWMKHNVNILHTIIAISTSDIFWQAMISVTYKNQHLTSKTKPISTNIVHTPHSMPNCFQTNCYHIQVETKWPSFCRKHFQMHFLNYNVDWSVFLMVELKMISIC